VDFNHNYSLILGCLKTVLSRVGEQLIISELARRGERFLAQERALAHCLLCPEETVERKGEKKQPEHAL
jgi:hypothetical protein